MNLAEPHDEALPDDDQFGNICICEICFSQIPHKTADYPYQNNDDAWDGMCNDCQDRIGAWVDNYWNNPSMATWHPDFVRVGNERRVNIKRDALREWSQYTERQLNIMTQAMQSFADAGVSHADIFIRLLNTLAERA